MNRTARLMVTSVAAMGLLAPSASASTLAQQTIHYKDNNIVGKFVVGQQKVSLSPAKTYRLTLTLYSDPQHDGHVVKIKTLAVGYSAKGFAVKLAVTPEHNQGDALLKWRRLGQKKVYWSHFVGRDDRLFRYTP